MLKSVTLNTNDVLNLDAIKLQLFIQSDDSSQDGHLSAVLASAREFLERETGKVFLAETWSEIIERFPSPYWPSQNPVPGYDPSTFPNNPYAYQLWTSYKIELQKNPVTSITSIKYYDTSNVQQTLASNTYTLVAPSYLPAFLTPLASWPGTYPRPDAVEVKYACGYTTPPPIAAQAIRLLVAQWYSYREGEVTTALFGQTPGIERILNAIRSL